MKSFHTLLKVAQRKLDEIAIEAARINQEVGELQAQKASIRAREQVELANAALYPDYAAMLPAYRQRVQLQVGEICTQIDARNAALADVRARLSTAYIEKSKFEQLIEQARLRETADRLTREQAQLDEVAITHASRTS